MSKVFNLVDEIQPDQAGLRVGVLALQGAFAEHINVLRRLGVEAVPVRQPSELANLQGLIIPGGESTTIGKLAERWQLMPPLHEFVAAGKPVWGTCAGMIFLAREVGQTPSRGGGHVVPPRLGVMDISVDRNAYGRQTDSFEADLSLATLGDPTPFRAVFIRAPRIAALGSGVHPLITHNEDVVAAVQDQRLLVTAFHPELTGDSRLHTYFLSLVSAASAT